jgi:hypothetical protein
MNFKTISFVKVFRLPPALEDEVASAVPAFFLPAVPASAVVELKPLLLEVKALLLNVLLPMKVLPIKLSPLW